ncbi:Mu transposase C-terminal domain-containing protein [Fulvimarina sp. MAC8]|uniref:Mu transposase C-terminal domain-containing protein n=1 Tax=Fulvimarina sp. MAC8 TaxID=3162874 RepID=UPI0032EE3C5A
MNAITKIETAVPIYDIAPRSQLIIDGVEYAYAERLAAGHKITRVDDLKFCETLTHEHLDHLIQTDAIRINEGFFTEVKAAVRLAKGKHKTFSDLTKPQAKVVLNKKAWCDAFLRLEQTDRSIRRSDAKLALAIKRIAAQFEAEAEDADRRRRQENGEKKKRGGSLTVKITSPSEVQLRRWVRRYEKGGFEIDTLVNQYNGPGKKRSTLCSVSYTLHAKFATGYASRNKPSKQHQFSLLNTELDKVDAERALKGEPPLRRLKRRAFEKMIDALDPFFVDLGRLGPEVALRRWGIVTTGLDVEKPFERLEMDEWMVSLMKIMVDAGVWGLLDEETRALVERKRLWLSVAIDARTRMIVAMRFLEGAPCTESALSTIELAMTDKSRIAGHVGASRTYLHAKPRSVAMDNATYFTTDAVIGSLVQLNINPVFPPAGLAEMRARIERVFGTLKTKIAAFFTGQTFSNIVEKGKYDAQANASINVDELNRLFLVGVLDLYHHHPHEGLGGETPYDCMRRLSGVYGLPLPPDRDVMRHVMGIVCERRIGEEGVRFLGIRFQSQALQILRREMGQKPVEIRIDRWDLSSISVRTKKGGWIVCNARFSGLENVSVWQWTEAVRDLRERNQHLASLSRHHVLGAVRTLSEAAAAAIERAEIANPILTAKTFDRWEKALFQSFAFADDGAYGEDLQLPKELARQAEIIQIAADGVVIADPDTGEILDDDSAFGTENEWSSN